MYTNIFKLIPFIISSLFFSCSCLIFPEFSVKAFSHDENQIIIEFSLKPDITKIKDSFSFIEDEVLQDGIFENHDNYIVYKPFNKIARDHNYKVLINTDAESINGISLDNTFIWEFSTKPTNLPLEIISFQQFENYFEIEFNSPINEITFSKYISVSPDIPFIYEWNDERTDVKLRYQKPLTNNTIYFFSIEPDLQNIYNNHLSSRFSYYFSTEKPPAQTEYFLRTFSKDKNLIELSHSDNNVNLINTNEIYLDFSNPVYYEDLLSSLSLIPQINFSVEQTGNMNKKYILKFKDPPSYGSTYKIKIINLKDTYNEKLNDKSYTLLFNNPENQNPEFIQGILELEEPVIFNEKNNYNTLHFPVNDFPTIDTIQSKELILYLLFNTHRSDNPINYYSIIENLDITSSLNCISIVPYKFELLDNHTSFDLFKKYVTDLQPNDPISAVKIICTVQNHDHQGLIKIKLNKEISDCCNRLLDKEYIFTFNKK